MSESLCQRFCIGGFVSEIFTSVAELCNSPNVRIYYLNNVLNTGCNIIRSACGVLFEAKVDINLLKVIYCLSGGFVWGYCANKIKEYSIRNSVIEDCLLYTGLTINAGI